MRRELIKSKPPRPTESKGLTGALAPRQQRNGLAAPWKPGQSGNPKGRAVGSRNKLSEQFLDETYEVYQQYGKPALIVMATKAPVRFCNMVALLIPQHFKVAHEHTITLSPEELTEKLVEARQQLVAAGVDLKMIEGKVLDEQADEGNTVHADKGQDDK
jgi:hypothetical protein